ncbi:transmembrane reductase CYB561D2 [Panulirus ornatus]|uniref:transmembrane reductase CYB561D2 n=1 Tax=Panulirus ornatus TaxID=150431 RepID=UPI003A8C8489
MLHHILRTGGVVFTLFVTYLAKPGSSLFSYHPTLMTVAFTGLMTEAIFMFSKYGLAGGRLHSAKITAHWLVLMLAAVAHGVGYVTIYYNKELNSKPHYTSWHGSLGLSTSVLFWLQLSVGIFVRYPKLLKSVMQGRTLKAIHGLFGMMTFGAAMITVALGLWSNWFQDKVPKLTLYSGVGLHILLMFIVCKKFLMKYAWEIL